MIKLAAVCSFILCLSGYASRAQEGGIVLVKGKIVSAADGEPIPYASVGLARNGIETMSNEEGRFVFKIPAEAIGDSIFISHIGFRSVVLLLNGADTSLQTISLKEEAVELPGVTVSPFNVLDLIRKAIDRIPENNPASPYVSYGFYRFDGSKGGRIFDLSEAVFDIYCPDNVRENKTFRLIKVRAEQDRQAVRPWTLSLGRTPKSLMDRDMVSRIHETQILGDDGINDHVFKYNRMTEYEGRPAYEILFDEKDGVEEPLYKGRILIDSASLAFVCFDYGLSPKGMAYQDPGKGEFARKILEMKMVIGYRNYGGKYYLNEVYMRHRIGLDPRGNKSLTAFEAVIKSIYLVTRVDTAVSTAKLQGKVLADRDLIEDHAKKNAVRDNNFWENYNSIEADYDVDSVFRAMRH